MPNSYTNEDLVAFYYALDVTSQSMFGEKFQTMQDPTHRWMTESLERGNRHMYLQLAWPSLFRIIGYFMEAERLSYPQFHEESKQFLDLCEYCLSQAELKEKRSIFGLMKAELPDDVNDDELHVDVYSLMRGGGDMVAVTIAAAFFYITQNQATLQKVQEEVRSVFTSKPPAIGPELETCAYLRACVDEALRMAPPGPGVFWRTSSSDLIIDGVLLPAGVEFGTSIYAVHYNSEIFDEPEEFRPERMMWKGEKDSAQREGLIPFLRGFRACPAQKMAHATILLSLARLIWEFKVDRTSPGVDTRAVKAQGTTLQDARKLFPQVDVFGSRIEGPVLSFRPRA
ncbi:unnamed protein product [Cercospora beticola]|nr:unnamed protein product [Cercospora beticola]